MELNSKTDLLRCKNCCKQATVIVLKIRNTRRKDWLAVITVRSGATSAPVFFHRFLHKTELATITPAGVVPQSGEKEGGGTGVHACNRALALPSHLLTRVARACSRGLGGASRRGVAATITRTFGRDKKVGRIPLGSPCARWVSRMHARRSPRARSLRGTGEREARTRPHVVPGVTPTHTHVCTRVVQALHPVSRLSSRRGDKDEEIRTGERAREKQNGREEGGRRTGERNRRKKKSRIQGIGVRDLGRLSN